MATFRQLSGSGKYQARIQRKGYETQAASFATLADAKAWARRIEATMDRGQAVGERQADKVSLAALLERYGRDIAPTFKGAVQEASRVRQWAALALAKREASAVKPADIAKWRDSRLQQVGPATVRRDLVTLASLYEIARVDWGYPQLVNPCKGVRKPGAPEGRTRRMDQGEVDRILSATDSQVLKVVLPLAIATAARRGELMKVCWRDISLKARTMNLRDTKNGDSRQVALSPVALAILEKLPRRLDGGHLFDVAPHSVSTAFSRAALRARRAYEAERLASGQVADPEFLTGLRFHDSRREGASQLFEMGLSIPEVASMTGHKDWRMLKVYTSVKAPALALKLQKLA